MIALYTTALVLASVQTATRPPASGDIGGATQIACAPRLLSGEVDRSLTIVGSQEGRSQYHYGPRDSLVVSGGSNHGVQVGQEFFVRRVVSGPRVDIVGLDTVGWIRIVAVDAGAAIAQVVASCDGMRAGDFLSPAVWPERSTAPADGTPDYSDPAHIVFAPDGRRQIGPREYAVIDQGADAGLTVGQQLTIFRRTLGGDGPAVGIATAVVVVTEPDYATIRLTGARDAVVVGDRLAPHR